MTDEINPQGQTAEESTTTAVATPEEGAEKQENKKLRQEVTVKDVGPCRKHIRVSVNREDISERMGDHFSKLVKESVVTGFRPGKAPRTLIEKRFGKEVIERVKSEVLLASLEQLGEENDVAPLAPPELDPTKIEFPKDGPMVYEFEVEVRPTFDLPLYRGLSLNRPVKTISATDVADARRRLLAPEGQIVPKEGGTAELGDILTIDLKVRDGDRVVGEMKELKITVDRKLAFKDGLVKNFAEKVHGLKAGSTKDIEIELSSAAAGGLAGKTVHGTIEIKDIKTVRLPELTPSYLEENFGLANPDQLDELIKVTLERNLEHQQRRSARMQVLQHINASSTWELPRELLQRQARRALARRIMELKADGIAEEEITKHRRLLEQDILKMTEMTLKEHFVLQKIAEAEKIEVNDDDISDEIERLADEANESPRKVRARLEKDDMMEALMAEMIERKALDIILSDAKYTDVPLEADQEGVAELSTVEAQAVPGQMQDPSAPSTEEASTTNPAQEGQ